MGGAPGGGTGGGERPRGGAPGGGVAPGRAWRGRRAGPDGRRELASGAPSCGRAPAETRSSRVPMNIDRRSSSVIFGRAHEVRGDGEEDLLVLVRSFRRG